MNPERHLVWDWNGTLIDDLSVVIEATNAAFGSVGGPVVTAAEHRRDFRRPIVEYYAQVLGRAVDETEFASLDKVFHDAYQSRLATCQLTTDAETALRAWPGTQSLLSMWFHEELLPAVAGYGLTAHFNRIDGRRQVRPGVADHKAPHLIAHLAALELDGSRVVLVGDTVDDAVAAAAAGAGCVLYAGGFSDPELLRATGAPVVETLVEAATVARTL